jgi:hypothetical protein
VTPVAVSIAVKRRRDRVPLLDRVARNASDGTGAANAGSGQGRLLLITLAAAGAVASVRHIYRLGPDGARPAVIVTVLPYALLRHYRSGAVSATLS